MAHLRRLNHPASRAISSGPWRAVRLPRPRRHRGSGPRSRRTPRSPAPEEFPRQAGLRRNGLTSRPSARCRSSSPPASWPVAATLSRTRVVVPAPHLGRVDPQVVELAVPVGGVPLEHTSALGRQVQDALRRAPGTGVQPRRCIYEARPRGLSRSGCRGDHRPDDGHNGPGGGGESGGSTAGAQTGMNPKRNAPILPPDLWRWRKLSGRTACVSDSPQ